MREEHSLIEKLLEASLSAAETAEEQAPDSSTDVEVVPEAAVQSELPIEALPAEELPVEEPPVEEPPAEEPPVEEPPAEELPVEEPPVEDTPVSEFKSLPYHERYYLKYRGGKRSTPLDLEGTKAFLRELGFDGGELRQARKGKDHAADYAAAEKSGSKQMYCSYCGAEIAGVEFFRLPDGRLRCTTCSNTVVKTRAEVESLCQRVISNMDHFFGAALEVPVSIEVVDERKLKRKIGVPLGTRDSQSTLILGVAISKRKKYSIILENGAPRMSLIATFAHELTHIWQYTHWDNQKNFKKCAKSKRLLIYEGMAKWAEIQYLYLIGEMNVARREEMITENRQDEYGIGFRLYADRFPLSRDTMLCDETPFTPGRYPFE